MSVILRGARLICPAGERDAVGDLHIANGRIVTEQIVAEAPPDAPDGPRILDAQGLIVTPGFIDLHCDLATPGHVHREGLDTGTLAAVRGGFTTVCVSPNTTPPLDRPGLIADVHQRAKALCRAAVRPIGAATLELKGQRLSEMFGLRGAGAIGVGDGGHPIADAGLLRRILEYARAADLPVFLHPATAGFAGVMHEGAVATRLGLKGEPAASEEIAVARAIALAELTGARVHIGPITTGAAVRLLADAKRRGVSITASTTVAHLHLTDAAIAKGYDSNLNVRPPLRPQADVDAVRRGLADGTIDAVGSGHVPRSMAEKATPFGSAAPGMMALETALGLALRCVGPDLPLARILHALSAGPAAITGVPTGLAPGARADLVVFDPEATQRVAGCASRARNTPFWGQALPGRVRWTLVAGAIAYDAETYGAGGHLAPSHKPPSQNTHTTAWERNR